MDNTARQEPAEESEREDLPKHDDCEVVELIPGIYPDESRFDDIVSEIEIWARRALSSNGFGDF